MDEAELVRTRNEIIARIEARREALSRSTGGLAAAAVPLIAWFFLAKGNGKSGMSGMIWRDLLVSGAGWLAMRWLKKGPRRASV